MNDGVPLACRVVSPCVAASLVMSPSRKKSTASWAKEANSWAAPTPPERLCTGGTPGAAPGPEPGDVVDILNQLAMPPMLMTRAVVPLMRKGGSGSIVNIASDAAKVPTPGEAVAGAGMAAIAMFSRTVALEVTRHHIRVNVVTPSLIAGTWTSERLPVPSCPCAERPVERQRSRPAQYLAGRPRRSRRASLRACAHAWLGPCRTMAPRGVSWASVSALITLSGLPIGVGPLVAQPGSVKLGVTERELASWPQARQTTTGRRSAPQLCWKTTGGWSARCRSPQSISISSTGRSSRPAAVGPPSRAWWCSPVWFSARCAEPRQRWSPRPSRGSP